MCSKRMVQLSLGRLIWCYFAKRSAALGQKGKITKVLLDSFAAFLVYYLRSMSSIVIMSEGLVLGTHSRHTAIPLPQFGHILVAAIPRHHPAFRIIEFGQHCKRIALCCATTFLS